MKPLVEFYLDKKRNRRDYRCKECRAEYSRNYYRENRERQKPARQQYYLDNREHLLAKDREARARRAAAGELQEARVREHLKRRYGLSMDDYDAILDAQDGVCAICRKPCASGRRLAVDHDHDTGRVRGLLCRTCNSGIGLLGDDADTILRAAQYLRNPIELISP